MRNAAFVMAWGWLVGVSGAWAAAEPASYARHVKPFLAKYCLECHNADKARGGLDVSSFKALVEGGDSGKAVLAGKPDESLLVTLAEGKDPKRMMPPKKSKQPKPGEIAVLRAWVQAGAKDDSAEVRAVIPDVKPKKPTKAPVAALAYHPSGNLLAAAGYGEVFVLDVASGEVVARLGGQTGQVTALAFNRAGTRLAVASGRPGEVGEVRLYLVPLGKPPSSAPQYTLKPHTDSILDVAWSPDHATLATTGYDRVVKLIDAKDGKELHTLKDHSDTVYGVAFHADGKLLASASADRAVKVWDVATGKRLYSLGEASDWLYALATSPDGKHFAAAGVDKSIRVWEAHPDGGKIIHSVFAHDGAILRLAYDAEGKTLYSLGEDRVVKVWDAATLIERRVYPAQPETTLALAVRPDHKQVALGRYDGVAVLVDEATGRTQSEPLPVKPKPPEARRVEPAFAQRGMTARLRFEGKHLDGVTGATVSVPGAKLRVVPETQSETSVEVEAVFPASASPGMTTLTLTGPAGASGGVPFALDRFAATLEQEPNDAPSSGQRVTLSTAIHGHLERAGAVDYYRFEARKGQEIGAQVFAISPKTIDVVLTIVGPNGEVIAESEAGHVGFRAAQAGDYAIGVRDRDFRGGGADKGYHLQLGDVPVVTSLFPLGVQAGREAVVQVEGVHLGDVKEVRVQASADAKVGSKLPLALHTPLGPPLGPTSVVVGEFPETITEPDRVTALPTPGTGNGRIASPGGFATFRFPARKGQPLHLEVEARRLGSPLDSTLEILTLDGKPISRAVLRCQAKTYVTLRDHDANNPTLRLEAWNELAVNDWCFLNQELLRIRELPKNPDDNCTFFSEVGKRLGFLDTTPTFVAMDTPLYKVSIHPAGTTFPPNGMPVFTLYYRNDDGGPQYGKDSRVTFNPPADGEYLARVGDARGMGGSEFAFRFHVREPRPDFTIDFNPKAPAVWKGGALPIGVTATRIEGFDGLIDLEILDLPKGFSAPRTNIPSTDLTTTFSLWADADAEVPADARPIRLVARAKVAGKEVAREVVGQLPKLVEPGEIVTSTDLAEVTLKRGGEAKLTVRIERRGDFKGRVPIEVRGLPHGVRVLDIGLNGILITPSEVSRTIVLQCDPWVEPTDHPFTVVAIREGKKTEHAAKSVLLRVTK